METTFVKPNLPLIAFTLSEFIWAIGTELIANCLTT